MDVIAVIYFVAVTCFDHNVSVLSDGILGEYPFSDLLPEVADFDRFKSEDKLVE